ncbi:hypothetical protein F5Y02DRAFT_240848 [Annulohypoxylon stygium]|nr:hypothetical protein F5Y02DRAFT_240848 [Annulohypoxylon stygium]
MASNGESEGSPHVPISTSKDQPSKIPIEEDESEWEYEYSTTETETFYVTLDLSKADFTSRDAGVADRPSFYRGGEKVERAKMYLNRRMSFGKTNTIDVSSSDDDNEMPRVPAPIRKPQSQPQSQSDPEPKDANQEDFDDHQVQIMELHSQNPMISYRGRIYSGVWSENVGTEFLLTRRDDDAPVPALRHLDHDVELLAASSARITVKEINLKPKDDALDRQRNTLHPHERTALSSLVPPAERWASKERIDQGNFLAKLIALKKEKGETDEVTVIAKVVERRSKKSLLRREREKQGHRGKFNLPHGRGPRRSKGSGILRTLAIPEDGIEEEGEGEGEGEGGNETALEESRGRVSTPTPRRWDGLGDQEVDEEDEEDEEGEEYGDGEDDDTMIMGDLDEEDENEEEEDDDEEEGDDNEENEEDEDESSSGSDSGNSAEDMDLDQT